MRRTQEGPAKARWTFIPLALGAVALVAIATGRERVSAEPSPSYHAAETEDRSDPPFVVQRDAPPPKRIPGPKEKVSSQEKTGTRLQRLWRKGFRPSNKKRADGRKE